MKTVIEQNKQWIDETFAKLDKKLSVTSVKSRDKLVFTSVNGVHDNQAEIRVGKWTNGFWGGLNWLMYEATGKENYRLAAESSEKLLDVALSSFRTLDHDVGFLWHLTAGASYRLTGNDASYMRNMFAAATLMSRYNVDGDYIRAWNGEEIDLTIIDTVMNLPQLYWASEQVNDPRFARIAMRHMDMAVRDHIREDGTINHIVQHSVDKPGVVGIPNGQGYAPESCWSRGLAWAVYGSILSYIHTKKPEYLEACKKTSDRFIAYCKENDYLPLSDFEAPKEPVYYDSTATMCAVCGILELAKYVSEEEGKVYTEEAIKLLKVAEAKFCNYEEDEDSIVQMGSVRYPREEAFKIGLHVPLIYGDFFFVEAMCKLKGRDFLIW